MKIFFPIIFLLSFTLSSYCQEEPNAFYLKRYSENQKYYVTTVKSSNWLDSNFYGVTTVKNSDNDSILYKIDKYFDNSWSFNNIFLTNDGSVVAVIISNLENINNENYYLKIYVKGKFVNSINLNKLIGRNDDQKLLFPFYRNEEIYVNNSHGKEYWNKKWHDSITIEHDEEYLPNVDSNLIIADKYPTFIHNDTLFIISKDLFLYKIYLKTLKVEKSNYLGEANNIKKIANQNKIVKAYYYQSYADEIIDKDKLNEHFAEILKMKSQYRISENTKVMIYIFMVL
jgi:hypothetical protein